jgi:hypothetical protein
MATPHNASFGILRPISARNALQNLEIHKVFLRFCAFFGQKFSRNLLSLHHVVVPLFHQLFKRRYKPT